MSTRAYRRQWVAPRRRKRVRVGRLVRVGLVVWVIVIVTSVIITANRNSPTTYRAPEPALQSADPAAGKAKAHTRIPHPHHVPGRYLIYRAYWGARNRN